MRRYRTRTLSELKTAEVNEARAHSIRSDCQLTSVLTFIYPAQASAIEKVRSDAHNAEVSLAEATEQSRCALQCCPCAGSNTINACCCRRAATADSIHARAQEELRVRDAEAKVNAATLLQTVM